MSELVTILEDEANFYSKRRFTLDGEDYRGVDTAKDQVKFLMLEIYGKALKGETLTDMGEIFRKEVKAL